MAQATCFSCCQRFKFNLIIRCFKYTQMMTQEDLQVIDERFTERYGDEYGKVYTCNDSNILLCELLQPYIPIDHFMNLLKQQMTLMEMYGCDKFIIDGRAIRGFHQPSMEWFYLTWKVEAYKRFGLEKHRQLFTDEEWFLKCIDAAQDQIKRKDPGSIVHTLDLKRCESLEEATNY